MPPVEHQLNRFLWQTSCLDWLFRQRYPKASARLGSDLHGESPRIFAGLSCPTGTYEVSPRAEPMSIAAQMPENLEFKAEQVRDRNL
jgi:hypothetical protein